jgi:hypothetical protein
MKKGEYRSKGRHGIRYKEVQINGWIILYKEKVLTLSALTLFF